MNDDTMTDTGDTPDRKVLTIRVGTPDDVFDELEERFAALDAAERPDLKYEVVLSQGADLNCLLSATNVELLRTIAREAPGGVRETAKLVDRDVRRVHDNLNELARLNLVRFETDGRAKRPIVWYDDIEVAIPLAPG